MDDLLRYLDNIVRPTFADFEKNPNSTRHAYLACVVTYHAIDRASFPKSPGNLRKKWRRNPNFVIVDAVAHHFKHIISDDEKAPSTPGTIPIKNLIFGYGALGNFKLDDNKLDDVGIDLHNLQYVIRECITFIQEFADS